MGARPRRFQAQPVMQPSTALSASSSIGAPTSVRFQPVFYRSVLDTLGSEPWTSTPLPLLSLVFVEGTDLPIYTREYVDDGRVGRAKKRLLTRGVIQPDPSGVALTLLSPPDETFLALAGRTFDGPSVATIKRLRKVRQKITSTWPTEYNASRFAFLPATTYGDTTCRIYSEIQRHFLENVIDDGVTWSLWTQAEVQKAWNYRVSKFLLETELIRVRRQVAVSSGQSTCVLPADTISVCRAAFNDEVLTRVDEWQMDNGQVGWESANGTPFGYIEDSSTGSLQVTLVPTPSANGTLNLIIVPDLDADPRFLCVPAPIPAVFTPYVKWGVIADLLGKEGEANDPQRAAYAEGRFTEGVEIGKMYIAAKGR